MVVLVDNIQWDANDTSDLPEWVVMNVDDDLDANDKIQVISDRLSDDYGFCHFGFTTEPEIQEKEL